MQAGKLNTDILICRTCDTPLEFSEEKCYCAKCGKQYSLQNGIINFLVDSDENQLQSDQQNDAQYQQAQFFENTIAAKLINMGMRVINSDYKPHKQLKKFLFEIPSDAIVVELGSGNRRLLPNCINVDLFPFPNVDILADVVCTNFADESVDYVILDTVLEHVPDPQGVINEAFRILKKGGKMFCIAPWIFPYHGYPNNFFNFSEDGLNYLFRDFSTTDVSSYGGPTSAMINLISEYFAVALTRGNRNSAYSFIKGLVLLPIFPLKYLDKLWASNNSGIRIAQTLCMVAKK